MNSIARLSICICTHDPRRDYLAQTLAALSAQTLDRSRWECIIIDNASRPPLETWLRDAEPLTPRILREETLGLVHARLGAIAAAAGGVIVFVDDDNLLAPDYLARVAEIFDGDPEIGVAGGRIEGKFEEPPAAWLRPFLSYYAIGGAGDNPIRKFKGTPYGPWYPRGAGIAVRTSAARAWAERIASDPGRLALGRVGGGLGGGEDIDLVSSVLDQGLAAGYDPRLQLTHLIPRRRLTYDYAARLIYNTHLTCDRNDYIQRTRRPPRPWPLEYIAGIFLYIRAGAWRPKSWLLATQLAKGRYEAWRRSNL